MQGAGTKVPSATVEGNWVTCTQSVGASLRKILQQHSVRQVTDRSVPIVHPTEFTDQEWKAVVEVDGIPLEMEVDTGASLSLVSEETYRHH